MEYTILVFLFTITGFSCSNDPCSSHGTIDEWQRSVSNNRSKTTICDSFLKEGWYRITSKAGEEMPTKCPNLGFRCSTIEPIWLNGTYPSAGQTQDLTACSSDVGGDCCKNKYPIKVKNCTGFYVYKLVPTAVCPQAYCFGKELPCPKGHISKNGFSPGCKYEPCLSVNHKLLDNWHRSFGNNETSTTICDSFLTPGWYKPISAAGNTMPTSCPKDGFRCGTIEPIWLQGTLPTVNQTVNGTACVSSFRRGCCSPSYDIQIRNCGQFNLYKLTSTRQCPQAYCFGTEVPCPVGETSDNGFTPGCEFDPCYVGNHRSISGEVKRSTNYTLKKQEIPIDDSLLNEAWYKIESSTGNDMALTKQPIKHCGTTHPVWMTGNLPSVVDKIVDRKVCMTDRHGYCHLNWNIKVKHCGLFRVYYLPPTPRPRSAYCFGTKPYKDNTGDQSTGSHKTPWIIAVAVLAFIIIVIISVYIAKKVAKRTRQDNKVMERPPPCVQDNKVMKLPPPCVQVYNTSSGHETKK